MRVERGRAPRPFDPVVIRLESREEMEMLRDFVCSTTINDCIALRNGDETAGKKLDQFIGGIWRSLNNIKREE